MDLGNTEAGANYSAEQWPDAPAMTAAQLAWARCRSWIAEAINAGPGLESIEDIETGVGEHRLSPRITGQGSGQSARG
jgi:hypothetical protein